MERVRVPPLNVDLTRQTVSGDCSLHPGKTTTLPFGSGMPRRTRPFFGSGKGRSVNEISRTAFVHCAFVKCSSPKSLLVSLRSATFNTLGILAIDISFAERLAAGGQPAASLPQPIFIVAIGGNVN